MRKALSVHFPSNNDLRPLFLKAQVVVSGTRHERQ